MVLGGVGIGLGGLQNCLPGHGVGPLNTYRGGDDVCASAVKRGGPGTLSPAWLLSALFLGSVPQTV